MACSIRHTNRNKPFMVLGSTNVIQCWIPFFGSKPSGIRYSFCQTCTYKYCLLF
jgi:hypothetical protein